MKKISIILALLACGTVWAQQDSVSELYNERVIVVGSYTPELEETQKVNIAPEITDTVARLEHKFNYSITPKRLTALYMPSRIKAARVIGEPKTRLYNNYFKLGFGNNWSPMAEIYLNSTRNKKMSYGGYATHHSAWGTIGKKVDSISANPDFYGFNHWSMTDVGGFLKYIIKDKMQLVTDAHYNHDYNLYYGFSDSTLDAHNMVRDSIEPSDYKIGFHFVEWYGGLKSLQTDVNKLGYNANVKVSHLWGSYGQRELSVGAEGDIHYGFPMFKNHKGIVYLHAEWQGWKENFDPTSVMPLGYPLGAPDSVESVRNMVRINPYVDFMLKDFNFHAGALFAIDGFSTPCDSAHFKVMPDVVISKSFMKEALNISLGATGGVESNSWDEIRMVNPYVIPGYTNLKATYHYDFWANMRLNFNKKLRLDVHAEASLINNSLTFEPIKDSIENMYRPTFEDFNKITVGGDFSFINDEMLSMELGGNYYHYIKPQNVDVLLLYRPSFDAHLNVNVNYRDKFIVKLQGLLLGKMNGSFDTIAGSMEVLDTIPMRIGLNLEFEYRHNKALSFFVKFDNIICQRYFYWANYPSQKFQFMGGLTYTIPTKNSRR